MSIDMVTTTKPERSVSTDPVQLEARRRARVRLLRDLVQNGLYRIDTDVLVETILQRFGPRLSGV